VGCAAAALQDELAPVHSGAPPTLRVTRVGTAQGVDVHLDQVAAELHQGRVNVQHGGAPDLVGPGQIADGGAVEEDLVPLGASGILLIHVIHAEGKLGAGKG